MNRPPKVSEVQAEVYSQDLPKLKRTLVTTRKQNCRRNLEPVADLSQLIM